jgi:micrococcal nuclease
MVFAKDVEVRPVSTDRYGRTIAWVYVDGACLNEALLKVGLAWHYKRYSSEKHLAELENEPSWGQVGLWSHPQPIAPWDFRHGNRTVTEPRSFVKSQISSEQQSMVFHGNVKSKKFHRPSCKHYNCGNCTATFQNRAEAVGAGYVPCGVCRP